MNNKCTACESNKITELFDAKNQTLSRYGLISKKEKINEIDSNLNLKIMRCNSCGLMFNINFEYEKVNYESDEIQEARGFSPRYKKFMDDSSDLLNKNLDLNEKTILEIGCGDGYFLSRFKQKTKCFGFEPSPERTVALERGIEILGSYFDWDKNYNINYDLVIMRQVLEHLPYPISVAKALKKLVSSEESNGYVYIEVPNSNKTFEEQRFADFYYEHCLYFTTNSLVNLFETNGFRVLSCTESFDGEVLSLTAKSIKNNINYDLFKKSKLTAAANIKWLIDRGNKIIGWGSSGNGPSFLNICSIKQNQIEYVIDSDARKQGKFIAGTNQMVVPPEILNEENYDTVILFTQFHKNDIEHEIKNKYKNVKNILTIEDLIKINTN
jgi:2-polyprenyl-3-methyl-5-hydroxy-6-metoxy-1,4-benzoquinol methylase